MFSFEAAGRKLPPVEGLLAGQSAVGTPNQAWLALDLLSLLAYLYEAGQAAGVRQILELPLLHCPEVLLLGMASARRCALLQAALGAHPCIACQPAEFLPATAQ